MSPDGAPVTANGAELRVEEVESPTVEAKGAVAATVVRNVAPDPEDKRGICRRHSSKSDEALEILMETEVVLLDIEGRVTALAARVRAATERGDTAELNQASTALAQVEVEANRLETQRVDNVYISQLDSGKVEAKEKKKDQLKRLEALFGRIDEVFKIIKADLAPKVPEAPTS